MHFPCETNGGELILPVSGSIEDKILDFLENFANKARYYNLRELKQHNSRPRTAGRLVLNLQEGS